MITEPIEALLAIFLISIGLAAIIAYHSSSTRSIQVLAERLSTRSVAYVIADIYSRDYVMCGSISFRDFKNEVGEICSLLWNRTRAWVNTSICLVYPNGTEKEFYINSTNTQKPNGDTITMMIPLRPIAFNENQSQLHWYVLSYRNYYFARNSTQDGNVTWEGETARFYFVVYTEDGFPVDGGQAQVTVYTDLGELVGSNGSSITNGICKISIDLEGSGNVPSKIHVFASYTGPRGESFPTREMWIRLREGDPYGRGEQQLLVNQSAQETNHFYVGETIYGRSCNRMNLTRFGCFMQDLSLPLSTEGPQYVQGPYNASVINGFDTSSMANIPFFLYPSSSYIVILKVQIVTARG